MFHEATGIPNQRENFTKAKKTFKARQTDADEEPNLFLRALRSGKAQDHEKSGFANYFVSVLTDKYNKGKKSKEAEID